MYLSVVWLVILGIDEWRDEVYGRLGEKRISMKSIIVILVCMVFSWLLGKLLIDLLGKILI